MSYVDINREDGAVGVAGGAREAGDEGHRHPAQLQRQQGHDVRADGPKGEPIDLEYAELRNRFEPLIEMMQIKGNSEVHRSFWGADEFANFENADSLGEFSGRDLKQFGKAELGALGRSPRAWPTRSRSASIPTTTASSAAPTATTARRPTWPRTTS